MTSDVLDPSFLFEHNLREKTKSAGNFSTWMGVNAEISPDDDIFRFFANHPTSSNPVRDYLSDGWRTMVELQELLDGHNLSVQRSGSFLEFACGHGRFTRHLARTLRNGELTVSDVVPGSVDFLKDTMGVKGFYSTIDPCQLVLTDTYRVIFVLSLFSHLPSNTWGDWFKLLYSALQADGLLIFSTHGEKCAKLAGVEWEDSGYKFYPSSESTALDGQAYGCTYSSTDYVTEQLRKSLGSDANIQIIPNHFWGNQDAVVISKK